ncbi:hypothetical protein ACSOQ0_003166 [Yersinia enterocolitica]
MNSLKDLLEHCMSNILESVDEFLSIHPHTASESWFANFEFYFNEEIKRLIDLLNNNVFSDEDVYNFKVLIIDNEEIIRNNNIFDYDYYYKLIMCLTLVFDSSSINNPFLYQKQDFSIYHSHDKYIDILCIEHINSDKKNCILYINFIDVDWSSNLAFDGIGKNLFLTMLALIIDDKSKFQDSIIIYSNGNNKITERNAVAALKLSGVMRGIKINSEVLTNRQVNYPALNDLVVGSDYQQFDDILHIAGEYNAKNELIDKYISIYHIIENFMFRYPIAKLLHENTAGKMFSIREFNRLYGKTAERETAALNDFLNQSYEVEISGRKIKKIISDKYKNLKNIPGFNLSEYNKFIDNLNIHGKDVHYDILHKDQQIVSIFSKLLYQTRCSIIHNKETEFHIQNSKVNDTIKIVLDSFLMECMELIAFSTIIKINTIVWYRDQHLELYSS